MGINVVVAQSDGPTSVINATLSGTLEQAFPCFKISKGIRIEIRNRRN